MNYFSLQLRLVVCLTLGWAGLLPFSLEADPEGPSLVHFDVEHYPYVDNPWGGTDSTTGNLKVITGSQLQVNDNGTIQRINFSPSVAVGDLNGDGLPDLVVADTRGFIWYYPNSGTKTNAVFTTGEVIPIWFGSEDPTQADLHQDMVPRIQLLDFNHDGKLDLVVGTFDGSLYMMPNTGTPTQPEFHQPQNLDEIRVPTRSKGFLWCNYLAPCLYDWSGTGLMDLVMGEGTYSANSIYLLRNQGSNDRPLFDENHTLKIIPGMGREQLTPRVLDWNGDGKPDIICGERSGYINLFFNTSTDPDKPTFAPGTHIKLGNQEAFGQLTSVNVVDLTGNKLPNLVVSSTNGQLLYATNTGTPGNPVFASNPVALKGKNPYPKIYLPTDWAFDAPYGNSYELMVATCAAVEPGFAPPPDHQGKFALRAYVMQPQNLWFKTRFFVDPAHELPKNSHSIRYRSQVVMTSATNYNVTFNVKATGDIENTTFTFEGYQKTPKGSVPVGAGGSFSTSNSWIKTSQTVSWDSKTQQERDVLGFNFIFRWTGTGSLYLDDIAVRKSD
jgi:hypothetical protein